MARLKRAMTACVRHVFAGVCFLCLCVSAAAFIAVATLNEILEIEP